MRIKLFLFVVVVFMVVSPVYAQSFFLPKGGSITVLSGYTVTNGTTSPWMNCSFQAQAGVVIIGGVSYPVGYYSMMTFLLTYGESATFQGIAPASCGASDVPAAEITNMPPLPYKVYLPVMFGK